MDNINNNVANDNMDMDMIIDKLFSKYTILKRSDIHKNNIYGTMEGIKEIKKIINEENISKCMLCFDNPEIDKCIHEGAIDTNITADDMYEHLLLAKDNVIKQLMGDIKELNEKLLDQSVVYNEKIDNIRLEYNKKLNNQYQQYKAKLSTK